MVLVLATTFAHADRIRDLTSVQGVRENSLIGYGLVVGLDGTGDQTTQTPVSYTHLDVYKRQRSAQAGHSWAASLAAYGQ